MFKRLISITVLLFIFLTMYPISTAAEINLDVDLDIKGEPEQTEEVNENDEPHDPSTNPDSLIEQLKEKLKEPGDKLKKSDDSNKNVNMSSSAGVDYVYYQEFEPNNSMELADPYYMNTWMQAYMDYYDMDYFRFDVTRYGSITLEVFSDYYAEYYLALYDQYGSIIGVLEKEFGYNETYSINVEPGTYYLVFLEPDYYYNYYYEFYMYYDEIYVEAVKLNKSQLKLSIGKSEQLIAEVIPYDATNQDVMWVSSDENIASVDYRGVVTGNSVGTTYVAVYTYDGFYYDSCKVEVSRFSDIPLNHWAFKQIEDLSNKNIINGYRDGRFGPGDYITRAQAAVMIVNALGIDYKGKKSNFKDVTQGYWAAEHIAAAKEAGVINGYGDGTFRPGEYIQRGQVAVMIANAFDIKHKGSYKNFKDVGTGHWAYKHIERLASNGIINGYKDNTFRPGERINRAQFSVILSNAVNQ